MRSSTRAGGVGDPMRPLCGSLSSRRPGKNDKWPATEKTCAIREFLVDLAVNSVA